MNPDVIERWQHALPPRIRAWLHQQLLPEDIITTTKLGWTGRALSIPIVDPQGQFAFFKCRKDPIVLLLWLWIGGDVIRFLMAAEHLTFREALTDIA